MTVLSSAAIPLIEDQIRMFGTVTLSSEAAHELLHRAAQSYAMQLTLEQIAREGTPNADAARWAARVIADEKRTRPKLKFPALLVKIEVA
jgi:hypothetical protein